MCTWQGLIALLFYQALCSVAWSAWNEQEKEMELTLFFLSCETKEKKRERCVHQHEQFFSPLQYYHCGKTLISGILLHRFNPPGQMSAGMTCEMLVTFKPMVSAKCQCQLCQVSVLWSVSVVRSSVSIVMWQVSVLWSVSVIKCHSLDKC